MHDLKWSNAEKALSRSHQAPGHRQEVFVFGVLLRESRIQESQLAGLSQDKQDMIKRFASL
jgi:hypothetical protein